MAIKSRLLNIRLQKLRANPAANRNGFYIYALQFGEPIPFETFMPLIGNQLAISDEIVPLISQQKYGITILKLRLNLR